MDNETKVLASLNEHFVKEVIIDSSEDEEKQPNCCAIDDFLNRDEKCALFDDQYEN
jgi:hypothetical protein